VLTIYSGRDSDSGANTASQSTRMSSTLASIKTSFIEKVNHAASIRRQRSSVDSDVSSGSTAADMTETVIGRLGTAPVQGGVHRRRIRSPFSSSRLSSSDAKKPSRSSLAEQRIIESVVFRPSTTSSSGRSAEVVDQGRAAVETSDMRRRSVDVVASSDVVVDRQRPAVIKRSLSHGQGHGQDQTTSSSTLVRSISTNNPLLPFVNGNFNELP